MTKRSDHKGSSYNAAKQALQLLTSTYQAQLAGGCVRDRLLGIEPADYDIATTALPHEVTNLFQSRGFKVIPTGIDHGTVTVLIDRIPLEITTLRKDVATDGRRATVAFGASFYEDAARRDFTINAMYEDLNGQITDFFSGRQHLQEGKLVFVGDPNSRIQEDYLRILRFFRFAGRFSLELQPEALNAIERHKQGLSFVSQERIVYELSHMLGNGNPHVVRVMGQVGVLEVIFKNLAINHQLLEGPDWDLIWQESSTLPKVWKLAIRLDTFLDHQETSESLKQAYKSMRFPGEVLYASIYCRDLRFTMQKKHLAQHDYVWILKSLYDKGLRCQSVIAPSVLRVVASLDSATQANVQSCLALWDQINARFSVDIPLNGDDIRQFKPELSGKKVGEALKALQTAFYLNQWHSEEEGMNWLKQRRNNF